MPLLETPLLGVGHLARQAAEAAGVCVPGAIGYSAIELWCVAVGLIFFFSFGLVVLYRLVAEDLGGPAAVIGIIGCWMGTSLFYYSVVFPFMAHAISFVLLVLVMHVTRALPVDVSANRSLTLLGLCLAAIFLVRPQQMMVAAFLLPNLLRVVRIQPTASWAAGAAIGATTIIAAVAAQVGINYSQFGKFVLSGYSVVGEGFAWLNPDLTTVLVSASRGLLVFSPVVVMAALGYIVFARSVPGYAWPAVGNAVAQVYLIAALVVSGPSKCVRCPHVERQHCGSGSWVSGVVPSVAGRCPVGNRWRCLGDGLLDYLPEGAIHFFRLTRRSLL